MRTQRVRRIRIPLTYGELAARVLAVVAFAVLMYEGIVAGGAVVP